jgi:hypothetical protein
VPNDVCEDNGGGDNLAFGGGTNAGQELLDLIDDGVVVTGPELTISTGEFHVLRAVDVLGKVPSRLHWDHRVVTTMHHEGGNTKPAETVSHVLQVGGSNCSSSDQRGRTEPLPTRQPLT